MSNPLYWQPLWQVLLELGVFMVGLVVIVCVLNRLGWVKGSDVRS